MPRQKKTARIQKWRGKPYLFYTDYTTGKSKRVSCEALGATNKLHRDELVRQYRAMEIQQSAATIMRGGPATGNSKLIVDVRAFIDNSVDRAETRKSNPEAREGLAASSLVLIKEKIIHFQGWLERSKLDKLKTTDLTTHILEKYIKFVIGEQISYGNKAKKRSAATINVYKRTLKQCLRWINKLRPRRFPDFELLLEPLKPSRGKTKPPTALTPNDLNEFLAEALRSEDPERTIEVTPSKHGRKNVVHKQRVSCLTSTPVSRLFLLCALTGCRLGEALKMKWEDIDLKRGRVTIEADKTGMLRCAPLIDDAAGSVAPLFVKLLEVWWREDPEREFVLPHYAIKSPVFPKGAWYSIDDRADADHITPQKLRQNFTSYAASLGIPASVAAMWQGHSSQVAEKHYRAQVLERNADASTLEEAMGLTAAIMELLANDTK